jgi:glycine/D-amino acid oxidase-like deaminating enzyme
VCVDTRVICIQRSSKKLVTQLDSIPSGNSKKISFMLFFFFFFFFFFSSFMVIATDKDRQFEYRKIAAFNRKFGVPVEEISAREVGRRFPLARTDDILSGFFVEGDGRANPVDAATSLSKGARQQGVRVIENMAATGTVQKNGRVQRVLLENGESIECDYVVNAAGMWARQLAEKSGVSLPNQACEHYYLITDPIPEVAAKKKKKNDFGVICFCVVLDSV